MSIKRDLAIGSIGEGFVMEILSKANIKSSKNKTKQKLKYYDLDIDGKATAEIKYDIYADRSGNIAIEYFNPKSGKNSGLYITTADFWIHVLSNPNRAYIVRVETLKSFVKSNNPSRIIERGGDGNASLMLYALEDILHIFEELTPENARKLIYES